MGIGRREFLKLFGTALTTARLDSTSAITFWNDYYINRGLGIAFEKPPGWFFNDVKEVGRTRAGIILEEDILPEIAEVFFESLEDPEHDPILSISQSPYSEKPGEFVPSVMIFLENYDEEGRESHGEGIYQEIKGLAYTLENFDVLDGPEATRISECSAFEYTATFLFKHEELISPTQVIMRALSIYQKPLLYDIRMYDSPHLGPDYTVDYDEFVKSIRLV